MADKLALIIKKYRKKLGWSQQRLAEEAKLSYGIIQSLEIGRIKNPEKTTLIKLADTFNITLDELVDRKPSKQKNKSS